MLVPSTQLRLSCLLYFCIFLHFGGLSFAGNKFFSQGRKLSLKGKCSSAKNLLRKALADTQECLHQNERAEVYTHLARCLKRERKKEEAKSAYKNALLFDQNAKIPGSNSSGTLRFFERHRKKILSQFSKFKGAYLKKKVFVLVPEKCRTLSKKVKVAVRQPPLRGKVGKRNKELPKLKKSLRKKSKRQKLASITKNTQALKKPSFFAKHKASVLIAGVGVLSLAVGAGMFFLKNGKINEMGLRALKTPGSADDIQESFKAANHYWIAQTVGISVGITASLASVVVFFVEFNRAPSPSNGNEKSSKVLQNRVEGSTQLFYKH